jgi:hypothetical protein
VFHNDSHKVGIRNKPGMSYTLLLLLMMMMMMMMMMVVVVI